MGSPSLPPRCSPGTWSLLLPPSTGLEKPGVPSSTGHLSGSPGPGCSGVSPGWLCSPPAPAPLSQREQQTYRGRSQRDDGTDILAPSCRLGSPSWCLQSGVTSAFRRLSHPPLCLASEISVCVCFFFFYLRDFFFFFFPSGCVRPVAWRRASYSSLSFSVQISSLSFIHTTKP